MKQQATGSRSRALAPRRARGAEGGASGQGSTPATASTLARDERIRQAAYGFYEARGRVDGHELEDWLRAEALVAQEQAAPAPQKSPRH